MRVAVVADIHGNLPALRAVLAELDGDPPEALVVGGDVVAGPYPRACLELLAARAEPTLWIAGNAEQEAVAVWDGAEPADDPARRDAAWSAGELDRAWRDRLRSWPITATLDRVRYCHGSPRRVDEILTRRTPEEALLEALGVGDEPLVVGGHTHQQMIRELPGGRRYVNAGSVGQPYEGLAAAFWLLVIDGVPQLRRTPYDLEAATAELRASNFSGTDDMIDDALLTPVDPSWVSAYFEHGAGRGDDPGPQPGGDEQTQNAPS